MLSSTADRTNDERSVLPRQVVDCYGLPFLKPLEIIDRERVWEFRFEEGLSRPRSGAIGLFVDREGRRKEVKRYPRSRRCWALTESPIDSAYEGVDRLTDAFPLIFTHQADLLTRGEPFRPLMFGTNWLGGVTADEVERLRWESPRKPCLVSFMGSLLHPNTGAYRLRRAVAEYVLARGGVDCFGKGIREIPGKREAIAPYAFSITIENAASDHYFSEKLVDCLLLETVPIYYGCPDIGSLFDPRGLLTFDSVDSLAAILDRLTPDLYRAMLPFAMANKEKVIREGWHNYEGLFTRTTEHLAHMLKERPQPESLVFRAARRLTGILRR